MSRDGLKERARELYVPGKFGYKKVAAVLGISRVQVARWCNEDYRKRQNFSKYAKRREDRASLLPAEKARGMKYSQAKFSGLPIEWFIERLERGVCEVTGLPFTLGADAYKGPYAPEVDQRVPQGGYTPENAQMVVRIYNQAKSNFSHEDVLALSKALLKG